MKQEIKKKHRVLTEAQAEIMEYWAKSEDRDLLIHLAEKNHPTTRARLLDWIEEIKAQETTLIMQGVRSDIDMYHLGVRRNLSHFVKRDGIVVPQHLLQD